MPPRATKKKATVPETPSKRVTRTSTRAGSATLEEPLETPTLRRGRSRSKTPESKTSSFEKPHHESQLPAVAEEEERHTPRVTLPNPVDVAPIADASPYVTPATYRQIAASTRKSLHESPKVSQTVQQSVEVYVHQDATGVENDNDEVEQHESEEEAVQEAVEAQLASETAEAGLSLSHPTPPDLKTTPNTSLAGKSSTSDRTLSGRVDKRILPSERGAIRSPLISSPLAQVSGNAASSPVSPLNFSKYLPAHFQRSPAFSSPTLMERSLKSDGVFGGLTDSQRTALLMDMRSEIMRLRRIEEQYLAVSKQSQPVTYASPQQLAKSTSQPPALQESSPDVPCTVTRLKDLRYQRSIAVPARARLLAEEADRKAAAAAAAEKKAQEEEHADQTPSRFVDDKRKSKTSQTKTPEAQTPQKSSQALVVAETPAASPSWGLGSLFGSVKNIFTHRPNLSPIKQHQDQPQEQSQEQQKEQQQQEQMQQSPSERAPKRPYSTPAHLKQQKRNHFMSPQQSPTPKAKSPAPPATPAAEETENYGQTPRTQRRTVRQKRDTPVKPKEPNADVRAQKLEQVAQKSAERQQAEAKADRLEKERHEIQEELRKSQMQIAANYRTGNKRKVNVDDLAVIPCSDGVFKFGMVDSFFTYDEDRDFVEMYEEDIHLRSSVQQSKRARIDDNVFEPKTPPAQPSFVSPVKQAEAPQTSQTPQASAAPATPAPNYSQLTQQAIEKQLQGLDRHKPKQPSRLRNVERLSTGSTLAASSPQQGITSPLQNIQEVSPVPQLPHTPPAKIYNWPAGEELETTETWERILKLYTPEMAAADHAYFTKGLIAAGANTPAVFTL
ncbi:hypothetical protein E4T42_06530 [Aureobasidium subglaciale]|nr:hypothetical protein E4T42_06530 [Aureobasidium subglaciale]